MSDKKVFIFICFVIAFILIFYLVSRANRTEAPSDLPDRQYDNNIKRVIDADTLVLDNGEIIKLAGIECPKKKRQLMWWQYGFEFRKIEHLEPEAAAMVENIIEISKDIRIDKTPGKKDSQGRSHAYVFVKSYRLDRSQFKDGVVFRITKDAYEIFLNGYLVRMGYAKVQENTIGNGNISILKTLEEKARRDNLGIWRGK